MKNLLRTLVCTIILILFGVSTVFADLDEGGAIDVILIIDTSGSMNQSDPERITVEAARLFIEMIEAENSRVGVIEFATNLNIMPLTPVDTEENRETLSAFIEGFVYSGWTDIGLAMREAAEMIIEYGDEANSPLIILFTDGEIALGAGLPRTEQESYEDVWWALEALEDSVPIYTIGLNYHMDVNVELLEEISQRTNALSFIIDEAYGLPLIFAEIYASHTRVFVEYEEYEYLPEEQEAEPYEPEPAPPEEPEPEPYEPESEPEPEPEPSEEYYYPEDEILQGYTPPAISGFAVLVGIILVIAVIIVLVVVILKPGGTAPLTGYFEVRALLSVGLYTAWERLDLTKEKGTVSLRGLLNRYIKNDGSLIPGTKEIKGIYIKADNIGGESAIRIKNRGKCTITGESDKTITTPSFIWQHNTKLVFSCKEGAKVEIIYKKVV